MSNNEENSEKPEGGQMDLQSIVERCMIEVQGHERIARLKPLNWNSSPPPSHIRNLEKNLAGSGMLPIDDYLTGGSMMIRNIPQKPSKRPKRVTFEDDLQLTMKEESFTRTAGKYRVVSIKSPFEFYLQRIQEREPFASGLSEKDHSTTTIEHQNKVTVSALSKLKIYGFYEKSKQRWHRVRLMDYHEDAGYALVYFLDDLMRMDLVPFGDLYELETAVRNTAPMAMFRCHLYDVIPPDGGHFWNDEACEWFRHMMTHNDQPFLGLQMTFQKKRVYGGPDTVTDVGMVLFEDDGNCNGSINWKMVDRGYAVAIGMGGNPPAMPYLGEFMPQFDFMKRLSSSDDLSNFEGTIPECAATCMSQVLLVCVKGPDRIYLRNVSKLAELRTLEDEMGKVIEDQQMPVLKISDVTLYQAVVCELTDPDDGVMRSNRAVVIGIETGGVEILLVDYGNILTVSASDLHLMPEKFSQIPSYVHRAHLGNICPLDPQANSCWSDEVRHKFNQKLGILCTELMPAFFSFGTDAPNFQNAILFENFKQGICFDYRKGEWVAEDFKGKHENGFNMKSVPMMATHFGSFGIDLVLIPKSINDEEPWNESFLVDRLVVDKEDLGMKLIGAAGRFDKAEYYRKLLRWYDRFWEDMTRDDVKLVREDGGSA